jgi:hypothetical protein
MYSVIKNILKGDTYICGRGLVIFVTIYIYMHEVVVVTGLNNALLTALIHSIMRDIRFQCRGRRTRTRIEPVCCLYGARACTYVGVAGWLLYCYYRVEHGLWGFFFFFDKQGLLAQDETRRPAN